MFFNADNEEPLRHSADQSVHFSQLQRGERRRLANPEAQRNQRFGQKRFGRFRRFQFDNISHHSTFLAGSLGQLQRTQELERPGGRRRRNFRP